MGFCSLVCCGDVEVYLRRVMGVGDGGLYNWTSGVSQRVLFCYVVDIRDVV